MARVLVIGGGPAGMMAAATAASYGHEVSLVEQNRRKGKIQLGKKLLLTGSGRCNVTNNSDLQALIDNFNRNGKFLYSALSAFSPADTIQLLAEYGLDVREEDRGRIFPATNQAADVIQVLRRQMESAGVRLISGQVLSIKQQTNEKMIFKISYLPSLVQETSSDQLGDERPQARGKDPVDKGSQVRILIADKVIIATGGMSYPMTGSTGDGYEWAGEFGHQVTKLRPSQVPLELMDADLRDLQGVSVPDVAVSIIDESNQKIVFYDRGDIIFTHFGISGPVILRASGKILRDEPGAYRLRINFLPDQTLEEVDALILAAMAKNNKGQIGRLLQKTIAKLPKKLLFHLLSAISICYDVYVSQLTKTSRYAIINHMANFDIIVKGLRPIEEAVVTSGGIDTSQIDARTMESKLVQDLYFAGEIIDIDANTGGYNIQAALSTGYVAGRSC